MLRLSEGVPSEIDDRFRKTPPESFFFPLELTIIRKAWVTLK